MLREEVIKEWNSCKKQLKNCLAEFKEWHPKLLKLKNATWKTYAISVRLFRIPHGREYSLDDIISLWETSNYYKIKPSSVWEAAPYKLTDPEKIVASWQVNTVKCLVVEEKGGADLKEQVLSASFTKQLKPLVEKIKVDPSASAAPQIKWK